MINNNQIDYIDIIKGREQKDGFKIRFINSNSYVYRKIIDEILNIKELSNTNKEMEFYEFIRTIKNLFKYIPAKNGSIITFKYDYTFLDELLQDVKEYLNEIYEEDGQNFYAVLIDDVSGKVLKVHEFAIETKIRKVKTENVSEDYILEDDDIKDISEGW